METSAIPLLLQPPSDALLHLRPGRQGNSAGIDLGGPALDLGQPGVIEWPGKRPVTLGQKSLDQLEALFLGQGQGGLQQLFGRCGHG
jgi:hypothetical protein